MIWPLPQTILMQLLKKQPLFHGMGMNHPGIARHAMPESPFSPLPLVSAHKKSAPQGAFQEYR